MAANEQAEASRLICLTCKRSFPNEHKFCPDDGTLLVHALVDALVGTKLSGLYEIIEVLGRGGTSIVYKARHALMDRLVAIKMLLWGGDSLREEKKIRRFQHEARTASRLNHPNIATLYDFGVSPQGQPYLVMEYVEGCSLEELVNKQGAMGVERATRLFIQICDAMEHAHQRGVVHRDLKPSNFILASLPAGDEYVKVVDFGVAELVSDRMQDNANLQLSEQVFGSPLYMSPEQCLNKSVDSRCDIYGLGVSMYQLLTGRLPFLGNTLVEVMSKHISEAPPSFHKADPSLSIPRPIEEAVMRCLRKVPAQRHQSMKSLKEHLQSALTGNGKEVLVDRKIRVYIVDDNDVIIEAIKQTLQRFEDVQVVGGARNANQALTAVIDLKPEIVLMDLEMPEMDGIAATKLLKEKLPKSHVLMMSSNQNERDIVAALRAGAEGFILKKFENNSLPLAVRAVVQGTIWLDPGINSSILDVYRQSAPDIVESAARAPMNTSRKDNTDDVSFVVSLADLFAETAKYEEAEALYRTCLTLIEKVKNASHPDLLKVILRLAAVYFAQDKMMQAEPLLFQALEIQTQTLGSEHPDTAHTLENIAELFHKQSLDAEAERFYYWALSVREKVQPPDHLATADTCAKLAQIYRVQQKFGQAEQFAELARRKQKRARAVQKAMEPTVEELAKSLEDTEAGY
jgi:serine/threonine protein kinase